MIYITYSNFVTIGITTFLELRHVNVLMVYKKSVIFFIKNPSNIALILDIPDGPPDAYDIFRDGNDDKTKQAGCFVRWFICVSRPEGQEFCLKHNSVSVF